MSVANNVSTPASRALARRVASEGLVLLKNDGATLPLASARLKRVALVGPGADLDGISPINSYIGNYAACTGGPNSPITSDPRCHVVSLREALANASAAGGWALAYAPGCDVNSVGNTSGFAAAIAAAAGADVIIAAVGLNTCQVGDSCSEGEANDRAVAGGKFPAAGLDLPGEQLPLLAALAAAYPTTPLVAVLMNGGPISSPWLAAHAAAILEAWYGGYEGGAAVADALLGATSPAGRLPVTVVASLDDLPPYTDVVLSTPPGRTYMYSTAKPLYPFGFGLSYAAFDYSAMAVQPPTLAPSDATFTVSASVRHAGGLASDEVVQLYGAFDAPSLGRASIPRLQLLAFVRLHALQPGSAPQRVAFPLPRAALALVDAAGIMRVQPGTWTLWLGGGPPSAPDFGGAADLNTTLQVL